MNTDDYIKAIHEDVRYIRKKQDEMNTRLIKVEVKSSLLGFIGGFLAGILK